MIDRDRLAALRADEERRFVETHPRSHELSTRAGDSLLAGVPMPWMTRWAGSFPLFVEIGVGRAARRRRRRGVRRPLPRRHRRHDRSRAAGRRRGGRGRGPASGSPRCCRRTTPSGSSQELARRFGLPQWQFAMTATDANRFVLRFARHLTGRPRIAVMDWCYHGTVDETLRDARRRPRRAAARAASGAPVDVAETTAVVPFNDADALDRRLAEGDVACLLMEPALTNIGIVLPDEGYLDRGPRDHPPPRRAARDRRDPHPVRRARRGHRRLGPRPRPARGRQADRRRRPAGGVRHDRRGRRRSCATPMLGHEIDVAGRRRHAHRATALALAAARAALSTALREEDFAVAIPLAERFTAGVSEVIEEHGLPWHVQRLGCRAEYWFCPPPRNGADAAAAVDEELEGFLHLWSLNRGVLLTPFHNMALFSPHHSDGRRRPAHRGLRRRRCRRWSADASVAVEPGEAREPREDRHVEHHEEPEARSTDEPAGRSPTIRGSVRSFASVLPPSRPPAASISRTTRLPMIHANGPITPQTTSARIPRTSTVVAEVRRWRRVARLPGLLRPRRLLAGWRPLGRPLRPGCCCPR